MSEQMKKKDRLQFGSYNGAHPNLCRGKLTMILDGKEIVFPKYCLLSRGKAWCDSDGKEHSKQGGWWIEEYPADFPKELEDYAEKLVNRNVQKGCCGGCI